MLSETKLTVSMLGPTCSGVAANPVSPTAVAAILGHWSVVADKLNEQLPLSERQSFSWVVSITTGYADEKPREAYAHGEVDIVEVGRLGGAIVKAHCPNVLFNEKGCFLKFDNKASIEKVVAFILESFKRQED